VRSHFSLQKRKVGMIFQVNGSMFGPGVIPSDRVRSEVPRSPFGELMEADLANLMTNRQEDLHKLMTRVFYTPLWKVEKDGWGVGGNV